MVRLGFCVIGALLDNDDLLFLISLLQGESPSFSADEAKTGEILATLKKLRAFHK